MILVSIFQEMSHISLLCFNLKLDKHICYDNETYRFDLKPEISHFDKSKHFDPVDIMQFMGMSHLEDNTLHSELNFSQNFIFKLHTHILHTYGWNWIEFDTKN